VSVSKGIFLGRYCLISPLVCSLSPRSHEWYGWVKAEGVIYDKFDETMIVKAVDMPGEFARYAAGQDFGLNILNFTKVLSHDII
jgi:hypothetical protein